MKSIFPDKMLEGGLTLSLDSVKAKFNFFELQIHELHWQTPSDIEHRALGDAYEAVYDCKDVIVEVMMGYSGTKTKSVNIDPIKNYSPGMAQIIVDEVIEFTKQLVIFAKMNDMPYIADASVALSGKFARIKYRLTQS